MKRIKQYKIAERAAYGFKKKNTEEEKLKRLIRRSEKKGFEILRFKRDEYVEDPKRLLELLIGEIRGNSIFYKKGSKYEYSLQPKIKEFLTKNYLPYVHREYLELINTLLRQQAEKTHEEYVRKK